MNKTFLQQRDYIAMRQRAERAEARNKLRGEALKAHGYHAPENCWTHKYQVPEGTTCDRCESALAATPDGKKE
ncbi:hypothetical protein LCGC14_2282660 [marine sediment metagenome]|uniref:Uncharacterized protein n=1 Tax=marine sediment metagenome TaxID=412755 RepID=A0A0F9CU40_9ZZZZ